MRLFQKTTNLSGFRTKKFRIVEVRYSYSKIGLRNSDKNKRLRISGLKLLLQYFWIYILNLLTSSDSNSAIFSLSVNFDPFFFPGRWHLLFFIKYRVLLKTFSSLDLYFSILPLGGRQLIASSMKTEHLLIAASILSTTSKNILLMST